MEQIVDKEIEYTADVDNQDLIPHIRDFELRAGGELERVRSTINEIATPKLVVRSAADVTNDKEERKDYDYVAPERSAFRQRVQDSFCSPPIRSRKRDRRCGTEKLCSDRWRSSQYEQLVRGSGLLFGLLRLGQLGGLRRRPLLLPGATQAVGLCTRWRNAFLL